MKHAYGLICVAAIALVLQVLPQQARPYVSADTANESALKGRHNQRLAGKARVIDGDTLEIGGSRIRLEGIDAPEINQVCRTSKGGNWHAGKLAANALNQWVKGRTVQCHAVGRDGYGRLLGNCRVGGTNLNAAMIRNGLAWAFVKYSKTYVHDEATARRGRVGLWAHTCRVAWDYRANRWNAEMSGAPRGCAIKGNITRKGRIYHMPWSQWYGRTRIEPAKGERWFCNERQALAAGWRPAVTR